MPDPKAPPITDAAALAALNTTADKAKALTAAGAAKLVKRTVVNKDGEASQVAVKADEVLAFHDHGTHVVVVTNDGQKFSSAAA